jgi:GNAT superfamily N-acetyltransferase
MTIDIREVSGPERDALPALDRRFRVERRLRLTLRDGALAYEAAPVEPYNKLYPEPSLTGCTTFVAKAGQQVAGRIDLSRHWTGFASIEDLVVAPADRGKGVGFALVRRAQQWVVAAGLAGLRTETQDVNVTACSLYARCDFRLSGFDADLYGATADSAGEIALFWYWRPPYGNPAG